VNCYNCGAATEPAQKFCEGCGAKVSTEPAAPSRWPGDQPIGPRDGAAPVPSPRPMASPEVQTPAGPPVSGPAKTLKESPILMGDGERLLRTYHAVQLRTRKRGEGTLYVTDARIVFFARAQGRGAQRASSLMQQVRLEDVCGLQAFVNRRTNVLLLVFASFMALFALISLFTGNILPFIVFFLIAAAAIAAIVGGAAERGKAGVSILARQAQPAMGYGDFDPQRNPLVALMSLFIFPLLVILRAQTAFDVQIGRPGPDSDRLIEELGALILDLQTRGEMAVAYWAGPATARSASAGPAAGATRSQALS
jgi:hypothetical protein